MKTFFAWISSSVWLLKIIQIKKKECKSAYNRDTCAPMFMAALYTTTKLWNQSRCLSVNEWKENVVYIHKGVIFRHKDE
jgi:hypothetical protein